MMESPYQQVNKKNGHQEEVLQRRQHHLTKTRRGRRVGQEKRRDGGGGAFNLRTYVHAPFNYVLPNKGEQKIPSSC